MIRFYTILTKYFHKQVHSFAKCYVDSHVLEIKVEHFLNGIECTNVVIDTIDIFLQNNLHPGLFRNSLVYLLMATIFNKVT